jgi:hypothetical protein
MVRIPHCLDSRLTDGGEVVSRMHRPHSTPQIHFFSGTYFCYRLSKLQVLVRLEGLGKLRKLKDLIVTRTRDFPAFNKCLNQLRYSLNPKLLYINNIRSYPDTQWL